MPAHLDRKTMESYFRKLRTRDERVSCLFAWTVDETLNQQAFSDFIKIISELDDSEDKRAST